MDTGQLIDEKYQIVRILGEGGMGAVYEARHTGTGRRVAVKVIIGEHEENEAVVARFQREARAAGSIETQHIAQVLDTGTDRATGHPYMVMEYLSGEDVQQCLQRLGPLEPMIALRVISQACVGLAKAHDAGVVHRDIKPANLYLAEQEDGAVVVKLLDFGIAKVKAEHGFNKEEAKLTQTGSLLGSPVYMSPEQARGGKVTDARTDVWSLGVVLYEVLTGTTPCAHCDGFGELILSICSTPARPVQEFAPWVPVEVARIVHRALAIDADRRYASIADMHAAIRELLTQGHALDGSMLVALPAEAKEHAAQRYVVSVAGVTGGDISSSFTRTAELPPEEGATSKAKLEASSATGAGVSTNGDTSGARRTSRSIVFPIAIVAAAMVAVVGVGGGLYVKSRNATAVADKVLDAPTTPSTLAVVVTSMIPTPSASAKVAVARAVTFAVVPPTASVEVDGAPASVKDGAVEIRGTLGSTHRVRVFAGKREALANVVISEDGAVPSKLELDPKLAAPGPKAPAGSSAGLGASSGAASSVKTGPVAPAQTPPKPTSSAVDRDFQ